jgi:hypothetical protein
VHKEAYNIEMQRKALETFGMQREALAPGNAAIENALAAIAAAAPAAAEDQHRTSPQLSPTHSLKQLTIDPQPQPSTSNLQTPTPTHPTPIFNPLAVGDPQLTYGYS